MAEEQCDHLVTEGGKCITCGEPAENPRWTMEALMKELDDADRTSEYNRMCMCSVEAKQIIAISNLADETWTEYDRRATENEEPNCPQRPRLRIVGGRLMRIPFHQIWGEVVGPAFIKAKELGYRGDYRGWESLVKDSCRS